MKIKLWIIIGILILSGMSLSYYVILDQSTTVFVSCDPRYYQVDDKCLPRPSGEAPVYDSNDIFFQDFTDEELERFFVILPNTVDQRKNFVIYSASNTDKIFHFHNQDTIPYKIDGISDNGKNSFTIFISNQSNWKIDEPDNNYEGVKYIKLSVSNPDTGEIYDWLSYKIYFTQRQELTDEEKCANFFDKIFDTWKIHVKENYGGPGQPILEPPSVVGLIADWKGEKNLEIQTVDIP